MHKTIEDFQKAAKEAGRDENSLEEFKLYVEAQKKTAERELGSGILGDNIGNTGASYWDEDSDVGIYFADAYIEIYNGEGKIVTTIDHGAREDLS